ncbi:MAG: helix-turn-helix domain-containing protein [Mucilaginibacter sp.]
MENPFEQINNRLLTIESLLCQLDLKKTTEPPPASQSSKSTEQETRLDIPGLANYLNCSLQTIHNLKKSGNIPFYRLGRKVYFKREEIDSIARVGKIKKGVGRLC